MGKKTTLITLAVFALLSCENPIQSGLGPKVDITVPVVSMTYPRSMGDHVKGEFNLEINARDDIGVEKVQVAITKDSAGNLLPEPWAWADAALDPDSGLWIYRVDTTLYPDGDLPVMIRAEDGTGKSVVFEGVYSSKNNPPEIELQIPAKPEDPARHMELVAGGVMIGIAKDLWGVAPGYPRIQFWHRDEKEKNPGDPADWQYLDSYAAQSAAEWAASPGGRIALEFQFHAVDRSDPSLPLEAMPSLRPGMYRFRFQIKDVDATSAAVLYPAAGYYELEVIAARELPVIAVTARANDNTPLAGQYHGEPFYIAADVSHTTGIYEAFIEVQKEGEGGSVVLARRAYSDNAKTGSGTNATITRRLETFLIEPGKSYIHTDVDPNSNIAPNDYPFSDGTYTFTIHATSVQTSYARQTLTVYIDTTPPEINITRVQPAVEAANPGAGGLDEYTVNGFIAADMSSYDANNIGVYIPNPAAPALSYREIKYLIKDGHNAAADAKALYEDPAARYFDNPAAPVYKRPGSTAQVIIDTTALVSGQDYYVAKDQYLYFIAKDKAGNYSFTAALLRVDQNTDKPKISITGFDPSQRSLSLLEAAANPNRLDTDRILSGTFTDDDAVLAAAPEKNVLFKIYRNGDKDPKADITVTAGDLTVLNNGKTVNFRASLPSSDILPDGTYSVEIAVGDNAVVKNALKPASLNSLPAATHNTNDEDGQGRRIYFVLDTEPPELTETTIGDTANAPRLTAREFNLGGVVSDINGLRSLRILQIEPGKETKTILDKTYTAPNNKSDNWSLPAAFLPRAQDKNDNRVDLRSGAFVYEIIAEDVARRTTKLTRDVVVDLAPPDLKTSLPAPASWASGSFVVVRGTETDNYRTGPVFYLAKGAPSMGAVAPDEFAGKTAPADYLAAGWTRLEVTGDQWADNVLLDTGNGGLAEGLYFFYAAAFDAAGNLATNLGSVPVFGVDQAAPDLGAVKFTGAADSDPSVWHVNKRFNLEGLVTDRNGLDTLTLTEKRDNEPAISLALAQPGGAASWPLKAAGLPWNHAAVPAAAPLSGEYTYTLRVQDRTGRADRISERIFKIVYDVEGPVVTIDNPAALADISGNTVYISGTAPDSLTTNDLSVWYHIDGSPPPLVGVPGTKEAAALQNWKEAGGASWSDNASLVSFGEGRAYLHVLAFDRLGNPGAVADREFVIDTSPPKIEAWGVSSTSAPPYTPPVIVVDNVNYVSESYVIAFTAGDSNELRNLPGLPGLVVRRNSAVLNDDGAFHTDASGSYKLEVNRSNPKKWIVVLTLAGQADGDYAYVIDIYDVKNKQNTLDNNGDAANAHKNFNVRVDTTGPILTVTNPSGGNDINAAAMLVSGTAKDATAGGLTVWYSVDAASVVAGPATAAAALASPDWTEAPGGVNWYKDDVPSPSAEGTYYAHFVAFDKLGNRSAVTNRTIYIDYNLPYMDNWAPTGIEEIGGSYYAAGPYTLAFTARDSNALSGVGILRDNVAVAGVINPANPLGHKSADVALAHTGVDGGVYSYVIELTDIRNKKNNLENSSGGTVYTASAFKNITVRVDTQGPELSVTAPAAGLVLSAAPYELPVKGIAPDSGIPAGVRVYYAVDAGATKPELNKPGEPGFATDWVLLNTADFSAGTAVTLSGGMAAQGKRYVHFIAYDRLGNRSAPVDRAFYVDNYAPQINGWSSALLTQNSSVNLLKHDAYNFAFTAHDTNGVGDLRIARNGTALPYVSGVQQSDPVQGNYTVTVTKTDPRNWDVVASFSGQADGDYSYGIEIEDLAGRINPPNNILGTENGAAADAFKAFNVTVDTEKPVVTVNSPRSSPAQSAFISSSKLFLTGDAVDAHPGPVYFWDGPETDHPASVPAGIGAAETAIANPASGWKKASGTSSWIIDYTLPGAVQEGARHVMIIAFDAPDNRSAALVYMDEGNTPTAAADFYFPYAVDTAAPQLSELTGNDLDRKAMPASFQLNGVVGDSNGVRTITIAQSLVGNSDPQYNFTYTLFNIWDETVSPPVVISGGRYLLGPDNGLNKPWDTGHRFDNSAAAQPTGFSLPLKRTGSPGVYAHADNLSGDFDYTISATDKYGRTTAIVRRVQVDVTPPEISLLAPPANRPDGSWFDATVNIRGSGSDAHSGISRVYYWFGKGTMAGSTYTPPAPPNYDTLQNIEDKVDYPKYWESASGYTSWSVPLEISQAAFAEGYYTLYVIAVDVAGNVGGKKTGAGPFTYPPLAYNFRVDKANPGVTETMVDPSVNTVYVPDNKSPLRKGSFNLNVKLEDSHGVSRLVVKQTQKLSAGSPGTTLTILDRTYAGLSSLNEPLGSLPWNAADGSGNFSSAAAALDGIYEYEFTVYDLTISDSDPANHKTGVATRVITVDTAKPRAHITDPGDGYQTLSSQMAIRGSSTDAFPGTDREIWYWTGSGTSIIPGDVSGIDPFNEANKALGKWQRVDGGISADWNKTIGLGNDEGYRRVAVVAVDRHENVSDIEYFVPSVNEDQVSVRYFSKDNAPPSLDENIIDTRGRVSRSPGFAVGGSALDTNGVEKIEIKQTRTDVAGSPVTVVLNLNTTGADRNKTQHWLFKDLPYAGSAGSQTTIAAGTGLVSSAPITFTPSAPYSGSGVFDYVITLYDVSGRITVEERHVTIDTDPPVISFVPGSGANPAVGAWLNQTAILAGSASDPVSPSSGVNVVYYAVTADSDPHPALYTAPGVFNGAQWESATPRGGFQNWNITLPITAASGNIAEGKHKLHIIAMDGAGNLGGAGLDTPATYLFNVDRAFPAITAKYGSVEEDGFYAPPGPGNRFALAGEFGDSYGVDSIQITQSYNGITKPIKEYADGAAYNGSYSQGSALWPVLSAWSLGDLPRDPMASSIKAPTAAGILDGVYTYHITVKDAAGKETTVVRVVSVDSSDPAAAITGPTELVNERWYDGASISVTGTASDPAPSSGIDGVYVWHGPGNAAAPPALGLEPNGNVDSGSAAAGWARAGIIVDAGSPGNAVWNSASYSLGGEGPRTIAVIARDKAGHMSAPARKTFWVDNAPPTLLGISPVTSPRNSGFSLSGQGWDSNGLKSLTVTQKKLGVGGAAAELEIFSLAVFGGGSGLNAGDAASWAMAPGFLPRQQIPGFPYALEDGEYAYVITLTDKSGRTATETRTVLVDAAPPLAAGDSDIAVAYPQPTSWISGTSLTIRGSAKDHNRGADPSPPLGTLTPSGIHKALYYASHNTGADPAAPADPNTLGVWETANYDSATQQWNATFDLAHFNLTAGTNKLWIRVYDNAGNLSGAYTRLFGVDQDDPAVTENSVYDLGLSFPVESPPSFAYARESNFTLYGAVTEANIDRIVITQHVRKVDLSYVNAAPVTIATLTTAVNGGITGSSVDKAWTLPANNLPRRFAPDGVMVDTTQALTPVELDGLDNTFIYTITAYDLAGKVSNVITRTVSIDKTGPTAVIVKPAPMASFQNSVIEISGTAADGTAVKSVYYRVTETPAGSAAADALLNSIAPMVGGKRTYAVSDSSTGFNVWSRADGTDSWSKYVDFSTYFGGSINEGALTLWVIAADTGNNYGAGSLIPGDPVRVDFTLDQNPPAIGAFDYNNQAGYQNISRLNKNIYANGDFSFSFDAWDTNALAASDPVVVRRNGTVLTASAVDGVTVTAQAHPTLPGVVAAKNRRVTVRQKAGGLADGSYVYVITATDLANKTTEKTITVVVDTLKPDLTIGGIVPLVTETSGGTETSNVNGLFWFNVNAMDGDSNIYPYQASPSTPDADTGTNGSVFGGVKYYLAAAPATGHPLPNPFSDPGGVILTQSAYRGAVNTATLVDGADYVLWVYARDGAGNLSSAKYLNNLRVKQSTDLPVVNIPAMGAPSAADIADGVAGAINLDPRNGGFPITGFVSDDDNVDALADNTKLLFYISQLNPANAAAAAWTPVPYGAAAAQGAVKKERSAVNSDKQWNFTYTVPQAYADGNYLFKLVVQDKDKAFPYVQNQIPAANLAVPAVAAVERVYRLSVDKEAPVITVTSIENTYKATQAISGTLKEANLRSFKVSLDGGQIYDAFDSAGNLKTSGELVLAGTGETRNWTLNIPAAAFNALPDGPHSLLWSAEDAVGNPGSLGKTFYKDSSGPDINFTNINEDQMYIVKGYDTNAVLIWHNPKVGGGAEAVQEPKLRALADVITDGTPKLTGTFSDEFSTVFASTNAADVKFWYRFDYNGASTIDSGWTEATGAVYLPNYAELLTTAAKTVRWQIPLSSLGQGYHTVDIKVFDRWGSENGLTVKASANDPAAGKYYPYERVAFRLDSAPPVITVPAATDPDKALVNGATFGTHGSGQLMFTLKAEIRDVTLSDVTAKIYVGNSTIPRHVFVLNPIVDGVEKTLVINSPFTETNMTALLAAAAAAGETSNILKVEIIAVDGAPRQTVQTLQFKMDGAPPTITTGNLVTDTGSASYPTVIIDPLPVIQGNISDDSGIGEATYTIEQWNYALFTWQPVAGGAQNLSPTNFAANFVTMEAFAINLSSAPLNLADGKYRVSFDLKDKASPLPNQATKINGTVDSINRIEFFIDRATPSMDIVQFKSPPFYSGTEVKEGGVDYMAVHLNVSDLNAIAQVRARLESDPAGAYPLAAGLGNFVPGANYRLLIPKTAYAEGLHTLTLEAKDGAGRITTITRDFTLDKTLPMLQIIEPVPIAPEPLAEITSEATIRGITVDNTSVSKLYYLFGRTEVINGTVASASFPANTTADIGGKIWREFNAGIDKNGATIAAASYTPSTAISDLDKAQGGGSLYNWTIRLPNSVDLTAGVTQGSPNGTYVSLRFGSNYLCDLPIRFMMIDSAGNAATYDYTVVVNPKGDQPTVTIASPSPSAPAAQNEVGGVITVVGGARDNDWIHRVAFRVIDGDEPDTASPKTLPVYNALAGDGYALDAVTNAAYAASPYSDSRGGWHQAPIVGAPGSNVQWSVNLNNNGGLNAPAAGTRIVTVQVLAYDTPAANHAVAQTMGEISTVKVTFVDGLPFVVDNSVIITPEAKNGVPFKYDDPVANKRVGGTINVKARIRDDNGLKELTWHGEDTTQYGSNILQTNPGALAQYAKPVNAVPAGSLNPGFYYMWLEGGTRTSAPFLGSSPPAGLTWAAPALTHGGAAYTNSPPGSKAYIDYELSLDLDTRVLANKAGPLLNKAGTWILSVLATDHTDFKMPANWTLQIDNYYPLGAYTGNGVAAGTNYQLQGLAWDTGAGVTVQGVKKVVAWFSRGPDFIPLNERDIGSGAAFKAAADPITVAHGRTDANKDAPPSGAMGNWDIGVINNASSPIKFPDLTYTRKLLADGTSNPAYYKTNTANEKFISGIEIDQNEPTADNDEDGFLEGMADAGNNFQWYARIDTTKFLDGLLTVHYLIYDHAGNPSYYSNNIFISNNPPKVTSVDIGTDILGVDSAEDPRGVRTVSANYGNTNITARNKRLSFKFYMQGDLGAKPFHYRFGFVSSRSSKNVTELVVGNIYAITAVGTANWEAVGAPSGYGVGATFMATDTTSFGAGTADLLTISDIHAANINSADLNDHVYSYTYTAGDFGSGTGKIADATDNDAWFVLRVYNSLKIPMESDFGSAENGGAYHTGAGGVPVYSPTGQFKVWDQPFDVVRVGVNVANTDSVRPEVKLWDFNPGGETAGINGLNGLGLGANGTAAQPPSSIDLTPNAAKSPNLLKGGLYNPRNNNRIIERSGHIEPRYAATPGAGSFFIDGNYGSATFSKDTLSGEVILRGFAYDEQRLGAVYLRIDSPSATGTEFKILQSDDSTPYNPANPGSRGLLVPVSGQSAFVYNEIGLEGHMAEWAYVWNTVNLPADFVAGDNVKVQVRVEDKRSAPNSSATRLHPNTGETPSGIIVAGSNDGRYPLVLRNADGWRLDKAANRGYNRIAVTLAPYLNSFRRDQSKGYNSLRSRQGWYAFSRGETIVAQGWNLKYPSGATTVTFNTASATVAAAVGSQTPTGITFTVPASAVSGNAILVANGVSTVNDRNDNRNPWNREDYNLSVSGNELWIDDRAAHIWATDAGPSGTNTVEGNDRMLINTSETPTDPALTMAPRTGVLWASWSNTANAAVYMNTNQGAAGRVEIIRNSGGGGQLTTTDLYFAEPQRSYATDNLHPTVFYHSNRIYGNTYSQTQSGGLKGYDPQGGDRFDSSSTGRNDQYNVELTYHNSLNTQFEGYHRVVYRGDNMHVSYYDTKDKSLKYWFGKSGYYATTTNYNSNTLPTPANQNGLAAPGRHWMNLDGGSDAEDTSTPAGYNHRVRPGTSATEGSWNFTRASMAGPWSAIDLQSDGKPVIAYFDAEHSTLRLAYAGVAFNPQVTNNNAVASATSGDFKVQYAMPASDPNYSFAGEYVSMQIDQTNNDAHLAFFRSNSTQLIYLKLRWTGSAYAPYGPSVVVDDSGANGKWADLALDRQNRPWISYQDISRAGNFDGVKMAYYDPSVYEKTGVPSYDLNGVVKTGWETMNVPAIYKASDNRTGIEVWPHRDTPTSIGVTKTWAAAVGYTNPDYYRVAYYLKPRN